MSDLINREKVGDIITTYSGDADYTLNALEEAGYRIVRAGMVPNLGALDKVEDRLGTIGRVVRTHPLAQQASEGARIIGSLRELAVILLDLDPSDVDRITAVNDTPDAPAD